MVTIKKYSNRRLYDTSTSSYVTLEELADKIREGTDVRVIQAKTNEDITQQILAQIILESRGAARLLPVPLLVRLIRMGEDRLAEFFGQFISWALEIYLRFKEGAETVSPYNLFGGGGFGGGPEAFFRMLMGQPPWRKEAPPWADSDVERAGLEESGVETPSEERQRGEDESAVEAQAGDVESLRREVAELKEILGSLQPEGSADEEADEEGEEKKESKKDDE